MKISKELYTFFKEWLEWAENGGKDHDVFVNHVGLCFNSDWWSSHRKLEFLLPELKRLLVHLGLDTSYPFGEEDYRHRRLNGTQHLCPKRLAFLREQIALYESYVENE